MEIKPCPFCNCEITTTDELSEGSWVVICRICDACGPTAGTEELAIINWNAAPRKEDVKMEKNCGSCKYNQDGYCSAVPPYKSFRVNDDLCCNNWEAKESKSTPLNTENPSGKPFIDLARDELDVIQTLETKVNEYLMAAEEAAELAQALLKYCRACGHGSWTPINPKDATDAVIEEYADLLLAMEASFPRHEGNKMFYNNLERTYKEKAKRWAERLKERGEE